MANAREWPAGIICVTLPDFGEAYAIRRPTTYQNLMATATSLFRARFDETTEMYIKTNDFGLEWPVEVLPDVWEMPEVHGFLRSVEIHTRMHGEGPSQLDFIDAQATVPLSPSTTPPRDAPRRAVAQSTPANRRANARQPVDLEPVSAGYRGHSEEEESDHPEPESSRNVRSRVSLQARGPSDNPRPIRTIREEPTNEEIMPSQESDITADPKLFVEVRHGAHSVTIRVRPQKTFASLFKTACNHFQLDKDTIKLFQMVAFDERDTMSPIECNLTTTLGESNVADDDVFVLLPYDDDY